MIADKLFPTFYVIELEGKAANLEGLLGAKHKIRKVYIHSSDFSNDVEAAVAGEDTLEFLRYMNPEIEGEVQKEYNPEFFPGMEPLEVTLQMEQEESEATKALEEQAEEGTVAVALTHRFDNWGDFVAQRSEIVGDDFSVRMKIAVHPQNYMLEKNLEKQLQMARLHGYKHAESPVCFH